MNLQPNIAAQDANNNPIITQIRDFNGGGLCQGLHGSAARVGGIPVGRNSIVYGGLAAAGTMTAQLEIELPDQTFLKISNVLAAGSLAFTMNDDIQGNIPYGSLVYINFLTHTAGTTFFYLETS